MLFILQVSILSEQTAGYDRNDCRKSNSRDKRNQENETDNKTKFFFQFYTCIIQADQSVWLSTDACISAVVTMRIERADLPARHTLSLVVP